LVAIKLHFGELGNLAYLRPNYVRVAVDELKKLGAKPFLTDANTLYTGTRSNAVDHLLTAYQNGFVLEVVGAPVIIADGLRGADEVEIPVDGVYVKRAKIGAAVALADALLVMTHFKGHEQVGFGGALKIWGWARLPALENSSSTPPRSPRISRKNARPAAFAPASAPREQSPSPNMPRSITGDVWAAGNAWPCALSGPWFPGTRPPWRSSQEKLRNTQRLP
jgi:hypothetical protein